jgi:hypothetical protein
MDSNNLKTYIEIYKYDNADNSGGTPIEQFLLYRKKYAWMKVRGGATNHDQLGNLPYTNIEWTIRYDSNIDYKCQIKYNDVFYKIEHIEIIDRKAWMRIQSVVYNER